MDFGVGGRFASCRKNNWVQHGKSDEKDGADLKEVKSDIRYEMENVNVVFIGIQYHRCDVPMPPHKDS